MNIIERQFQAFLDEMHIITILLPLSYHNGLSSSFSIANELQNSPLDIRKKEQIDRYYKYTCYLTTEISFDKLYWIIDEYGEETDLQIGAVIRSNAFDEKFYYSGNDLGVRCEDNLTRFKLWAPTATQVKVKLWPPDGTYGEIIKMKREEKGVWTANIHRDLEYFQYTFLVCVNKQWQEAVDPYANAVTANGEHGMIVKMEKTKRLKPELPLFEHPVDAVIYEIHIRDFTNHPNSGVQNKGLYLGTGELGTKGVYDQLTGLSYLKTLGITHIEFLPFNDFAGVDELKKQNSEYNWGYNPLHYNVPEGSYSTDAKNPYARINELKQLIEQIHREGLRVIMDVVYNHVYIREQSSFEKIVPGYYFRYNEFGYPSNGTGVGNDIASERRMVRKFIVDSIRFWIEEYHIDGFRFDLMGILDLATMSEVRKTCDQIAEGTLLLGEGWNLNTPLVPEEKAILSNQAKIPTIAQFNDWFRDSIKGNTFNLYDKGYALGNEHYFADAKEVIAGSIGFQQKESRLFNEPLQSVNYVECHDNHTMWDKLKSCCPDEDITLLMKYHRLATCIVLLSQGIPFLHSGQEFFRTKNGIGNSYRSPDSINQLDWDRSWKYSDNVNYIKGIIQIRKTFPCFRLRTADEIRKQMYALTLTSTMIGFSYQNQCGDFREMVMLINPWRTKQLIPLEDGEWYVLADEKSSSSTPLKKIDQNEIELEPICLNILARN